MQEGFKPKSNCWRYVEHVNDRNKAEGLLNAIRRRPNTG